MPNADHTKRWRGWGAPGPLTHAGGDMKCFGCLARPLSRSHAPRHLPKGAESWVHANPCTLTLIAALFTFATIWKERRCPPSAASAFIPHAVAPCASICGTLCSIKMSPGRVNQGLFSSPLETRACTQPGAPQAVMMGARMSMVMNKATIITGLHFS